MRYVNYKSKRFNQCSAWIRTYELENGKEQIEFWSYNTPILIQVDGKIYENNSSYSRTTAKQKSQYCSEYGIDLRNSQWRTEEELRNMCF